MADQLSVLGTPITPCSMEPRTGFFRDGCCNTSAMDAGSHTVCVITSEAFLRFSKSRGNDLSTPLPDYGFPGLKPGDRWCLCAARWVEALQAGAAPPVLLAGTNIRALEGVPRQALFLYAVDNPASS